MDMIENFRSHRNWYRSLMKIWQSKIFVINTIARNSHPIDDIFPRLTEKVCYFFPQQIAEFRDFFLTNRWRISQFFLATEWSISRCSSRGQLTNFAISYPLQIGEFHDCFYRDQMTKFTIFPLQMSDEFRDRLQDFAVFFGDWMTNLALFPRDGLVNFTKISCERLTKFPRIPVESHGFFLRVWTYWVFSQGRWTYFAIFSTTVTEKGQKIVSKREIPAGAQK